MLTRSQGPQSQSTSSLKRTTLKRTTLKRTTKHLTSKALNERGNYTMSTQPRNPQAILNFVWKYFASQDSDTIVLRKSLIDLCNGNHIAALMLSQLIYWHNKYKDIHKLLKITYEEWNQQLRITKRQASYNKDILVALGYICVIVKKFNNIPCVHYTVNFEKIVEELIKLDNSSENTLSENSEIGKSQNVTLESDKMSLPLDSDKMSFSYNRDTEITSESGGADATHTPKLLSLKKKQAEESALQSPEAKAIFEERFAGMTVSMQQIFDQCREHYEQKSLWATKNRFIRWLERERIENYKKHNAAKADQKAKPYQIEYNCYVSQFRNDRDKLGLIPSTEIPLSYEDWVIGEGDRLTSSR